MASQFRTRGYRPYGLVHITARGLGKRRLIFNSSDREYVLATIRKLINQCPPQGRPKLLSYGVVDNHIHFLFQHGADPTQVKRIMHVFKRDFALRFNEIHNRAGPVWESPFRGRVVRGGDDIINVVTYIHLNPDSSLRMTDSSHPIYLGEHPAGIISTELVLKAFGGLDNYRAFFEDSANLRAARSAAKRRINK